MVFGVSSSSRNSNGGVFGGQSYLYKRRWFWICCSCGNIVIQRHHTHIPEGAEDDFPCGCSLRFTRHVYSSHPLATLSQLFGDNHPALRTEPTVPPYFHQNHRK